MGAWNRNRADSGGSSIQDDPWGFDDLEIEEVRGSGQSPPLKRFHWPFLSRKAEYGDGAFETDLFKVTKATNYQDELIATASCMPPLSIAYDDFLEFTGKGKTQYYAKQKSPLQKAFGRMKISNYIKKLRHSF